jgi:hypothetical protein
MFSSKRGPTLGRLSKPNPYLAKTESQSKKKKKKTKTMVSQKPENQKPSEKPKTEQPNI